MSKIFFNIFLVNGFKKSLTYFISNKKIEVGDFVKVPLKKKYYWGFVSSIINEKNENLNFEVKEAIKILNIENKYKFFLKKLSNHYFLKEQIIYKKLISFGNLKKNEINLKIEKNLSKDKYFLNKEQFKIYEEILNKIKNNDKNFYLHGLTGSGKTLIYLYLAKHFFENLKKSVIVIYPDTVLANYGLKKFKDFFGESFPIFSFHSESSKEEKENIFSLIDENKPAIFLGVHLPVFLPVKNIGLCIIDEEHDSGFIEKTHPFINSRDALIVRSNIENSVLFLCSATPSIDSWQKIKNKFYNFYSLKNRFKESKPAEIKKIIFSKENISKESKWITNDLKNEIKKKLEEKKQILLFLNQKGLYRYARCKSCTKILGCNNCSSFYTIYENYICICHRCEKKITLPEKCIYCNKNTYFFENSGIGTSSLRLIIEKIFPEARVAQADSKILLNKKDWEILIEKMSNFEIDILIGTKMITRGYHFKNVELVGLICADMHVGIPHISSYEKTLQEIIQVSGRAGRESSGIVFMQTLSDHDFYKYLSEEKYLEFCENELSFRKFGNFFPFYKNSLIAFIGKNENSVENASIEFYKNFCKEKHGIYFPPIKSYFYKIKNEYAYCIYGKAENYNFLSSILNEKTINFFEKKHSIKIKYVPNPENYAYKF